MEGEEEEEENIENHIERNPNMKNDNGSSTTQTSNNHTRQSTKYTQSFIL